MVFAPTYSLLLSSSTEALGLFSVFGALMSLGTLPFSQLAPA